MTPNDPHLTLQAVESHNPGPASADPDVERRRIPRVSLPSEQFRLASNGKIFAVADLSSDGMALRLLSLDDRVLFPIGASVDGWLNIDRRKHRISAAVRNIRGEYVGCEFADLGSEVQSELGRWLNPAHLGQTLRLMPTPVGFGTGSLDWVWHHGRSGTEVLVKLGDGARAPDDRTPEKMVVVLWGTHFVEWTRGLAPVSGSVKFADDRGAVQGVFRVAPELFHSDSALDPAKLNLARTLVAHSKLPEAWKAWAAETREAPENGS